MDRSDGRRDRSPSARRARWLLLLPLFALPGWGHPATLATPGVEQSGRRWIGSWSASSQPFLPGTLKRFRDQTVRLVVHTSAGGKRVRIRISNRYGDQPLQIGEARIARRTLGANVDAASDRELTFRGERFATIAAGSMIVSDAVALDVPAMSDLAISLFLPGEASATTSHALALQTSYVANDPGNVASRAQFPSANTLDAWPFLTGVDVEVSSRGATIVALGSSTTDGDGTTPNANRRWPDLLAGRLQKGGIRAGEIGVLNQGIIGNRLLRDSPPETRDRFGAALGEAGLARFDRDVLEQPGVRYVLICLGINDISFPGRFTPASEAVSEGEIIAGYRQLIARARRRGVRVIGTTIPPFEGARSYTPAKDAVRHRINVWIRSSREFDAVVDFDLVLRDPSHPSRLLPSYDSGDHLHSNDDGHAATANAIPLELFGEGDR